MREFVHKSLLCASLLQENCKDTAFRWIRHQNGSTDDLPVELLHTIFRFVLPPSTLLDPTPSRGPHSPWVQALASKLSLGRVSKRWHSSVLPFMYEEVTFRYATQVQSFARSLRQNPDLSYLVKRIIVDCPVTAEIRESVTSDLAFILTRCTSTDPRYPRSFPVALTASCSILSRLSLFLFHLLADLADSNLAADEQHV